MNISIITYHRVYNYGAALQAYATVKCFEKLGCSAEVIDYIPPKVKDYGSFKQVLYETKLFHSNIVKCFIISLLKMSSYKKRVPIFDSFLEEYIPMTKPYYSEKELEDHLPVADLYCTGSDQVWNNTYLPKFDLVYFLAFAPGKKKISFSSSFGRKNFTSNELNEISPFLNQYSAISVREKSGLDLIKGLSVKLKECLIDPTLILTTKEWIELSENNSYTDYILVYQLHGKSQAEDYAIALAKEIGKKTIKISLDQFKHSKCDHVVRFPSVKMFLSLFAKASIVVTDSFHGTAFSLNFNRNFIVTMPGKTGERIQSILELTGLAERIVHSKEEACEIAKNDIDFNYCNRVILSEREKAMRFLKEALEI